MGKSSQDHTANMPARFAMIGIAPIVDHQKGMPCMAESPTDAIVLAHASKWYGQGAAKVAALTDVSITIGCGRMVALIGRSGSGKTTLLNLLGAVDRPTTGSVRIAGCELTAMSEGKLALFRRRKLGYVFQAFHLVPSLTALENVALPLMLDRKFGRSERADVGRLLARLGLSTLAARYPDELSGGQQQRVAIARAVVHQPAVLLADEPTGNLDVQTGREILDLLQTLPREFGVTVVMATHSVEAAGRCDQRLVLEDGRLISGGGA
jgi:putative ABC transport system ATP-binding protein